MFSNQIAQLAIAQVLDVMNVLKVPRHVAPTWSGR
jgi:hypothetical protein